MIFLYFILRYNFRYFNAKKYLNHELDKTNLIIIVADYVTLYNYKVKI